MQAEISVSSASLDEDVCLNRSLRSWGASELAAKLMFCAELLSGVKDMVNR